jgi:hypothetical protein
MVPLHIAAIAVLVRVAVSRRFDPWLRLTAWAAIAQHPVAWFYLSYGRYYLVTWFLTLLVCAVWLRDEGLEFARHRWPGLMQQLERSPVITTVGRMLDGWAALTGIASPQAPR